MSLYPHQTEAALRIERGEPTYLAFEMGLGKSRAALEAAMLRKARSVLILCPASALLVWKAEVARWALTSAVVVGRSADFDIPARFFVMSYGHLSRVAGAVFKKLSKCSFDMTILDEAQYLKAGDAKRTKAFLHLAPKLGFMVPLSGTPAPNHAGELYTILKACYPQALLHPGGSLTRLQFEDQFCVIGSRYVGPGRTVRVIEGSRNLPQLKERIAPFMVRVRKDEVLRDLPPLLWDRVQVPVSDAYLHSAELQDMTARVRGLLGPGGLNHDNPHVLAALKAAEADTHLMKLRRILGMAKTEGSAAYIRDLLDALPLDRKVLVFAHHRQVIEALTHAFPGEHPAVITGESTAKERDIAVMHFLTDPRCRLFLGNIQAAGTALTLIGPHCKCSDVVFVESSWSPMDNAQAACRVHRIGQHDGVVARMLSAAGTIDDVVQSILVRKAHDFTALFDTNPQKEHA